MKLDTDYATAASSVGESKRETGYVLSLGLQRLKLWHLPLLPGGIRIQWVGLLSARPHSLQQPVAAYPLVVADPPHRQAHAAYRRPPVEDRRNTNDSIEPGHGSTRKFRLDTA